MTLAELEKRVRVLEDIEEIKQLHYDYIYALNARKWEELIDMFAEDMVEDGFPRGEIRKGKRKLPKSSEPWAKALSARRSMPPSWHSRSSQ